MAAEDHLGEQFEELQKNRAVRIGGRNYPAVWSHEFGVNPGYGAAVIPMENGQVVHAATFPPGRHDSGFEAMTKSTMRQGMTQDEFHAHLDELSRQHLSPADVQMGRETIQRHLQQNAVEDEWRPQ
jgi:hypothetical protein